MNRRHLEIALVVVLAVSAIAHACHSALGGERIFVVVSAVGLAIVVAFAGAVMLELRLRAGRRLWPIGLALAGCFAMLVATAATNWPLQATFAYSRPQLDRLAAQVRAGDSFAVPAQVGPFTIRRAEHAPEDVVCLWTDLGGNGNVGFAHCPPRTQVRNLWSQIDLTDQWCFVAED